MAGQCGVIEVMDALADIQPDRACLVDAQRQLSYRQVRDRTRGIRAGLEQLGLRDGQRFAFVACDSVPSLELILGAARGGMIACPLSRRLSARELTRAVVATGASLCLVDAELMSGAGAGSNLGGVPLAVLPKPDPRDARIDGEPEGRPDRIFVQVSTSGTTGAPKGVMLSHEVFLAQAFSEAVEVGWRRDDTLLTALPMSHVGGLTTAMCCLLMGGAVVALDTSDREPVLAAMAHHRATVLGTTPAQLARCGPGFLAAPETDSLRAVIYGGGPMSERLLLSILDDARCDLFQNYGMTEMGPTICVLRPGDHRVPAASRADILRSVGRPIVGAHVKVTRDDGTQCATGEVGEIVARAPSMMSGYFDDPDSTQRAVRDGWYHTEDLGWWDERGYLHLAGRTSDRIVTGGENVSALEVEEWIRRMEPVEDVAVVGMPDDVWGEVVAALVVPVADSGLDAPAVMKFCKDGMAGYKCPRIVVLAEEVPRNQIGKPDMTAVRQILADRRERQSGD
jgi:acyl-CoA synthetase (AMP-forming)/AMP-acid ligase II